MLRKSVRVERKSEKDRNKENVKKLIKFWKIGEKAVKFSENTRKLVEFKNMVGKTVKFEKNAGKLVNLRKGREKSLELTK